MDKVKNIGRSDKSSEQPEGTHGPHSSRVANAADPRVDSDRDHRARQNLGSTGEYSNTGAYTSGEGTYSGNQPLDTTGAGYDPTTTRREGLRSEGLRGENIQSGVPEGTFGPHSTRAANVADPRVDSDLDNSRNMGLRSGAEDTLTTGNTYGTGARSRTQGETLGTSGYGTTTTGREDVLGGENIGTSGREQFGSSGRDTFGTYDTSQNTSGLGSQGLGSQGLGTQGLGTQGTEFDTRRTGPAPNTAGPHKSDMMNKMDPRIDSDLDGSKTLGAEKTFSRSTQRSPSSPYANKDPTDAAQVPPSVMQQHLGEPIIAHNNPTSDHARRHSISHQEQHRGL